MKRYKASMKLTSKSGKTYWSSLGYIPMPEESETCKLIKETDRCKFFDMDGSEFRVSKTKSEDIDSFIYW